MGCGICDQEVKLFYGRFCIDCYPRWWDNNKKYLRGFGCVIDGCLVQSQNSMGMCKRHNIDYWQRGGKSPAARSPFFNRDGSRKTCVESGCRSVVDSEWLCRYHYQHRQYRHVAG